MKNILIKFNDLGKVCPFTNHIYSESCWVEAANRLRIFNIVIPITISADPNSKPIGAVKIKNFNWPCIEFEGKVFDNILSTDYKFDTPFSFSGTGNTDYDSKFGAMRVTSFNLTNIFPSAIDFFDSVVLVSDIPECELECERCKQVFERFEHIVKYNEKFYHENCFYAEAIARLDAEEHQIGYDGKLVEENDDE